MENCWDIQNCGWIPDGWDVASLGICPAYLAVEHDRTNGGTNGGRYCWNIAGTFCGGKPQGTVAAKLNKCLHCFTYTKVKMDQADKFVV